MGTIVLKLSGPLQSWGADSRYSERKTQHEPTKSAIVGLLAAALGRRREDRIDDLARFKVGVRTDQPGDLLSDYQTSHRRTYDKDARRWKSSGDPYLTTRYYLTDAVFVAGIELPENLIYGYSQALLHPAFPLFLGRRSCPPADKILLASYKGVGLKDALCQVPWQATSQKLVRERQGSATVMLDAFLDVMPDDKVIDHYEDVRDYPVSFSQEFRQYEWRRVLQKKVEVPNPHYIVASQEHDPFAAFEEVH